jgi:riboflavin biosynthesis pyrimidine reductase
VSGELGGRADHALFAVLRSPAEAVLVAAGTVRAQGYGLSSSRSPWPTAASASTGTPVLHRPACSPARSHRLLGVPAQLGQGRPLVDVVCLTLSPWLPGGDAKRILIGPGLPAAAGLRLYSVCQQDDFLFLRYRPRPAGAQS